MSAANREREPGSARARTDVRNRAGSELGTQPEALVDLKPIGKITKNTLYFDKNTQVHMLQ